MYILNCVVVLLAIVASTRSQNIKFRCGRKESPQGLVVNGTPVVKNQWPWLVSIFYVPTNHHFCGGSLISENHVITAAHCIQDKKMSVARTADQIVALLGKHDLSAPHERGSESFYPTSIVIHPDWNPNSVRFDADLALLYSEAPVQFSLSIIPICLPSSKMDEITEGTVAGWGIANLTGPLVAEITPKQAEVVCDPLVKCYQDNPSFASIASERMICAHGKTKNSGPCSGDSGKFSLKVKCYAHSI